MVRRIQSILVVVQGNSLQALVRHLDHILDSNIVELNFPIGIPFVYEFDEELHPLHHFYLGNEASIRSAIQAVSNQGFVK